MNENDCADCAIKPDQVLTKSTQGPSTPDQGVTKLTIDELNELVEHDERQWILHTTTTTNIRSPDDSSSDLDTLASDGLSPQSSHQDDSTIASSDNDTHNHLSHQPKSGHMISGQGQCDFDPMAVPYSQPVFGPPPVAPMTSGQQQHHVSTTPIALFSTPDVPYETSALTTSDTTSPNYPAPKPAFPTMHVWNTCALCLDFVATPALGTSCCITCTRNVHNHCLSKWQQCTVVDICPVFGW